MLAGALGLLSLAAVAAPAPPFAGQTYGQVEAQRGEAAYARDCTACHGSALTAGPFGPALKGDAFAAKWGPQGGPALLTYIRARMPPGAPGSLSPQTYADIAAYIMREGGASRGAALAVDGSAPAPRRQLDAVGEAAVAGRKARLDAMRPVTDAMLASPPEADWLMWRRTYDVQGFSPLRSIDKANVSKLQLAWSWTLPESQNEATPLVHDGVMFLASGNLVQALDAANGDLLWSYSVALPSSLDNGRRSRSKTLAIYGSKLFVPTAEGRLLALDARSGTLVWDSATATPNPERGNLPVNAVYTVSGGPTVAKGKVMIGVSLGLGVKGGCYIIAFDAETGKEAWRFNTIAQPGQPGGDSWNGAPVDERYGAGVWTPGSYDAKRNLVFFGVGNTYNIGTLMLPKARKGESADALYTDATLAIDPDTGKLVWFYQHMQRDVWDQDWAFERTLATLPVDGKPRDVVITAGKGAIFDVLDRDTGRYLFSKDLGMTNVVVAIDPKTGRKTTDPKLEPESGVTKTVCPSGSGARNWLTTALNPATRIVYVPILESCSNYTWTARSAEATAAGGIDITYPPRLRPDTDGNLGRIAAVNLETRQVAWTVRQRAPFASSMLATAGGVVFTGSIDRRFRAYDQANGKVLWETRLPASPSSSPATYAVGGEEQYLAVVAGGGGSLDGGGKAVATEIDSPAGGVTVMVFKRGR
jgi:alcohol dehydrogenase (cytochrome c)